jgi:cytochrome c oxidase subunit 6b
MSIEDVKANLITTPPSTAPVNPHFPNQNQAKYCYALYTNFHKCLTENDGDEQKCFNLKRWTSDICSMDWRAQWDDLREAGAFPQPKE